MAGQRTWLVRQIVKVVLWTKVVPKITWTQIVLGCNIENRHLAGAPETNWQTLQMAQNWECQ